MTFATEFPTLQEAVDAAWTSDGRVVVDNLVFCNQTTTLRSNVEIVGTSYGKLVWSGGVAPMFTSPNDRILKRAKVESLNILSTHASHVFGLNAPLDCVIRDVEVTAGSPTQTILSVSPNIAGETNEWGNRNAAFNRIDNLSQRGQCGTFIRLIGIGLVNGPPIAVSTLNNFSALSASGVHNRGIDLAAWADTNHFGGLTYINLLGSGSVGVEFNSDIPTSNLGVYANNFDHLAVDCWSVGLNRVGVKMNTTKSNRIEQLDNNPPAERGSVVMSPYANGCLVRVVTADGSFVDVTAPSSLVSGGFSDSTLRAVLKKRGIIS